MRAAPPRKCRNCDQDAMPGRPVCKVHYREQQKFYKDEKKQKTEEAPKKKPGPAVGSKNSLGSKKKGPAVGSKYNLDNKNQEELEETRLTVGLPDNYNPEFADIDIRPLDELDQMLEDEELDAKEARRDQKRLRLSSKSRRGLSQEGDHDRTSSSTSSYEDSSEEADALARMQPEERREYEKKIEARNQKRAEAWSRALESIDRERERHQMLLDEELVRGSIHGPTCDTDDNRYEVPKLDESQACRNCGNPCQRRQKILDGVVAGPCRVDMMYSSNDWYSTFYGRPRSSPNRIDGSIHHSKTNPNGDGALCICGRMYERVPLDDIFSWCGSTSSYRKHQVKKKHRLQYTAENLYRTLDEWVAERRAHSNQHVAQLDNLPGESDSFTFLQDLAVSCAENDHISDEYAEFMKEKWGYVYDESNAFPAKKSSLKEHLYRTENPSPRFLYARWEWHTDPYCRRCFDERFKSFYEVDLEKQKSKPRTSHEDISTNYADEKALQKVLNAAYRAAAEIGTAHRRQCPDIQSTDGSWIIRPKMTPICYEGRIAHLLRRHDLIQREDNLGRDRWSRWGGGSLVRGCEIPTKPDRKIAYMSHEAFSELRVISEERARMADVAVHADKMARLGKFDF